jgi:hypothetical protein
MNTILWPIVRGDRATVSFAALTPIIIAIMAAVTLALTPPARAQSAVDSSALVEEGYAEPPATADPPADAPIDGIAPIAAADSPDDSAAANSGWVRSDDTDSDDGASKVLEVPQVVDPANAQPGKDQAAHDGDSSSEDQVGSVDDYQDEYDTEIAGVYIPYIPVVPGGSPNPYGYRSNPGLNPSFGPSYAPFSPAGSNIARPGAAGMNGAIGPTSPMFPHNFAPIPGGWGFHAR